MASAVPITKDFSSQNLNDKLTDLEGRVNALEKEYDCLLEKAEKLEDWANQYVGQIHHERRLVNLIEVLTTQDKRSDKLLDYLLLFFNVVIAKMRFRGANIENMKDLWYQSANEDMMKLFSITLGGLGFVNSDVESAKMILDLVYERDDSDFKIEKDMVANDPATPPNSLVKSVDPEVQTMLLFLQDQEDLDNNLKIVLRRAVATAHSTVEAARQSDKTVIRFLNFKPTDDELCSNAQSFQHIDSGNYCLTENSTSRSEEICGNSKIGNEDWESRNEIMIETTQPIKFNEIIDNDTDNAVCLPISDDDICEVGISYSNQAKDDNITEQVHGDEIIMQKNKQEKVVSNCDHNYPSKSEKRCDAEFNRAKDSVCDVSTDLDFLDNKCTKNIPVT